MPRSAARRAYHLALGRMPSDDPGRSWQLPAEGPALKLLHVGDCGFRQMEWGHDMAARPGFPLVAAELLREREGIGMVFGHYFATGFEYLPDMASLERHMHLDGEPDVVIIQTGGSYARKVVLPHTRPIHRLRADANRRAGRLAWVSHPLIRQWVRFAGRYASPYPGVEDLERFLLQLRQAWPKARLVVIPPFPRSHNYRRQLRIAARTDSDVKAAARRCGVPVLDACDILGFDRSLRCANAYNLNARGSRVVGELLADWIAANVLAAPVEQAPAARV